jgi:NAD(P)-dependent dehydrogenase (short-subunit alcohol dehydrogenase family)
MTVSLRLDGELVLVTGASSGLGAHAAQTLAAHGADVVVAARRTDRLQALVQTLQASGVRAHAQALDVSDAAQVEAALDAITAAMGRPPTRLVNAAGVAVTANVLKQTERDWDTVMDTNLKGAWLVSGACARRWVERGEPGVVLNIASITGLRVAGGVAPYCASKAGLIQLTQAMALELARHGIRVNALAPGYVETELNRDFLRSEAGERLRQRIPLQRFGQAQDLDGPLLLLLSEAGRYISGAVLAVDGGHLVSGL